MDDNSLSVYITVYNTFCYICKYLVSFAIFENKPKINKLVSKLLAYVNLIYTKKISSKLC